MSERYQAAIVGGGIVGCALLYWLTRLGFRDVILLERRELTSGSTWHAAGNTTFFGHYPEITSLFVNSIKTYQAAEEESGQSISFHPAGSLRLASKEAEMRAYHRLKPIYDAMGVPYQVVSAEEIRELHPLLNTEGLLGAAHTPTDGHVDASGTTQALAKAAQARGAVIKRWSPVTAISTDEANEGWQIETDKDVIAADNLVLASSFWTRELALPLGLHLPLYPLQHHEIVTEAITDLEALDFEVPTVRDPRAPANIRQEGMGFLCGVYETEPEFWALDGIPTDFTEELLPPDIDRLELHLLRVMEALPAFGSAGIKAVNNGPICYTPDGLPLLGPVESHPGLWLASGFAIGIGTGGGSAEYLAKWIVEGRPEPALQAVHPNRFPDDLSRDRCLTAIRSTYARGYDLPDQLT